MMSHMLYAGLDRRARGDCPSRQKVLVSKEHQNQRKAAPGAARFWAKLGIFEYKAENLLHIKKSHVSSYRITFINTAFILILHLII